MGLKSSFLHDVINFFPYLFNKLNWCIAFCTQYGSIMNYHILGHVISITWLTLRWPGWLFIKLYDKIKNLMLIFVLKMNNQNKIYQWIFIKWTNLCQGYQRRLVVNFRSSIKQQSKDNKRLPCNRACKSWKNVSKGTHPNNCYSNY